LSLDRRVERGPDSKLGATSKRVLWSWPTWYTYSGPSGGWRMKDKAYVRGDPRMADIPLMDEHHDLGRLDLSLRLHSLGSIPQSDSERLFSSAVPCHGDDG
jgi:hypothetical protein